MSSSQESKFIELKTTVINPEGLSLEIITKYLPHNMLGTKYATVDKDDRACWARCADQSLTQSMHDKVCEGIRLKGTAIEVKYNEEQLIWTYEDMWMCGGYF